MLHLVKMNRKGNNNFCLKIKFVANDNSISDACSNIYRKLQFMSFEWGNKIFDHYLLY